MQRDNTLEQKNQTMETEKHVHFNKEEIERPIPQLNKIPQATRNRPTKVKRFFLKKKKNVTLFNDTVEDPNGPKELEPKGAKTKRVTHWGDYQRR